MATPNQPPRGGLSLYANLLNEPSTNDSSATISRGPVSYDDTPAKKSGIDPAALRFQPIRRPQVKQAHNKPKAPGRPKVTSATVPAAAGAAGTPPAQPARSTLADWQATEDDEYLYGTGDKQRRERGGRRKKKKKRMDDEPLETDWDELYDPARPTNVEEYLRSEERIREVREWKALLYAHRRRRRGSSYDSDMGSDREDEEDRRPTNQFAPPSNLSFAPPPLSPPRPAAAAASVPLDTTGDDAYARRLALSSMAPPPPPAPPLQQPPDPSQLPPPPPPPVAPAPAAVISRAPVRYEAPPQPPSEPHIATTTDEAMDLDNSEDEEVNYDLIAPPPPPPVDSETPPEGERTTRPGQKGFAQRLMSKYGWTKGSGLGADESGITSALRVQVEKRRKRPDAEGGGFAEPGGKGKIIAPKTKPTTTAPGGKFGKTSSVIVLRNMLENMPDLDAEIEAGDLTQEIGEECGDKYGRVERLYIDRADRQVFIKFTDAVSALRAVNALEGRIFNGNTIQARFYDSERFEEGVYK
ncbi:hypothetical protein QBC46DRAFT_380370 [Diplogelasinospora grovesii]|uniref:G-patch domain-containing protein n=1 Tax=Diplogelasinospora grovesii TaxID=303347 RepID=A0AAN6NBZ3_9PEZI|nr:hypothetical protein QBC46DRAFT_380370 [Diplogelasinospora grovesii]